MLNKDFYPTPKKLIQKMLEGVDLSNITHLLEPSAGKGDICDYIKEKLSGHAEAMDVIELDEDLQAVLRGKGYHLVFNDFLDFNTNKKYDLILANFPFSNGDKHLLKAIQIQEVYGGGVVCLVNAETLKNPFTNLRKSITEKLEKYGATIEYLEGEFMDAERKTGVEVAVIRLFIEPNEKSFLILDNLKKSQEVNLDDEVQSQLVEKDFIRALIARFNLECKLGINLVSEYFALKPYLSDRLKTGSESDNYDNPLIELKIRNASDYNNSYVNEYLKGLRSKYWQLLFRNDGFRQKYTSNIQKELSSKLNDLQNYDFNLFNIKELEKELGKKITSGVEDAILSMFDQFSAQFSYFSESQKNIHYYNGWKTNKAHKINKKIIIPINGFSGYYHSQKDKLDNSYIREKIEDMVIVFNYLASELSDIKILVLDEVSKANVNYMFSNLDFHYFTATFYKKGTCHITFKDQKLLEKFNIYGSQRKGWLPPSYGKRAYSDMDDTEKSVIDGFQGRESYEEVIRDKDYYLVTTNNLLLETNF